MSAASASRLFPAGQSMHTALSPTPSQYFPAAHRVHVPTHPVLVKFSQVGVPEYPLLQRQTSPLYENVPKEVVSTFAGVASAVLSSNVSVVKMPTVYEFPLSSVMPAMLAKATVFPVENP